MPRGGYRPGAGRKPKIMKVLGEGLIERIFSSIGDESKRWADLYQRVVKERDTATEFQILRELANRKYGKPKEAVDVKLSFTDMLARVRERHGKVPALPAATPGDGHSDEQAAEAMPGQDSTPGDSAERPATAKPKIKVDLWTN